jgi:hypothetical protein
MMKASTLKIHAGPRYSVGCRRGLPPNNGSLQVMSRQGREVSGRCSVSAPICSGLTNMDNRSCLGLLLDSLQQAEKPFDPTCIFASAMPLPSAGRTDDQ